MPRWAACCARAPSPPRRLRAMRWRALPRATAALHAFVLVTEDRALEDARRADDELKAGRDRGPFHGIPYALKDIYDTAGIRTTCHSKLRLNVVPKEDSVAAARLREAGGVLLGKLATHEFAIGGPSFDLPFPPARNPWNPEHVTGGSSSGSGTAIGARMVRMAMGSDTGGSIRGPAAWCGTVGIKATYGRVSRRGVFPLVVDAGSHRPADPQRGGCCDHAAGAGRTRSAGSRQRRCSRSRLSRRPREGCGRFAHRHPARLLRHGVGDDSGSGCGPRPHRSAVARGGRDGGGHRTARLRAVLGCRARDHDGGSLRDPRSRHADQAARLWRDHRRPLHPRRGDHRGGLRPCAACPPRADRRGQRRTVALRRAADLVGAEHGPTIRSADRCAVVGVADPDHSVQRHRPSGDERADRPGRKRAADRRADRRPGIR